METPTNEALLQEMLRSAEKAEEPGDTNKIVRRGDDLDTPPTVVTSIKSAGYSYIYDTLTHERSLVNNNMLPSALKKKRPDGSMVFSTVKPEELVKRGTLKCTLHPDNPNREYYDTLGLPVCLKSNLTSPFQVKRHMQKRHHMEYEALEEERLQAEKDRSIKLQESLILAAGGKLPQGGQTESRQPHKLEIEGSTPSPATNEPEVYVADHPYIRKKDRK